MTPPGKYTIPVAQLDRVRVPREAQVEEQDVHVQAEYVTAEELDRSRLLSPTSAGKLHPR